MSDAITEPVSQPDVSDSVKRGRYLVRIADCIGCHTAFEAPLNPGFFGGGNFIELEKEKAFSTNITPDPSAFLTTMIHSLCKCCARVTSKLES